MVENKNKGFTLIEVVIIIVILIIIVLIALPSYLHEDLYNYCDESFICTTYGYWTKNTYSSPYNAWSVDQTGSMTYINGSSGVRHVIIISKNLML